MQSAVMAGKSRTCVWNGWMVTPRGVLEKHSLSDRRGMPPERTAGPFPGSVLKERSG